MIFSVDDNHQEYKIIMKLTCPNCGEAITAENINIQDKIAVCHACNTVFQFALPDTTDNKPKRRKVHQPSKLTIHDDNHLHMSFHTNWRLEQNETFSGSIVLALVLSLAFFAVLNKEGFSIFPLILGFISLVGYYSAAFTAFNKTHIEMNDHVLRIARRPLPGRPESDTVIHLSDVESITTEETVISKQEGYDMPRYHVYAVRFDGSRQIVVRDVPEEYGRFIARVLNEELVTETDNLDISRLEDSITDNQMDTQIIHEDSRQNLNHK